MSGNKTLLVIGGTGYFGKSILDSFQRGLLDMFGIERVVVMARNTRKLSKEAPSLLSDRVELFEGDIATVGRLPEADIVIHAAASTDAARYLSRPLEERLNIQAGTYNYCLLAPEFHRSSKILYVSSGAVYGTQPVSMNGMPEDYVVQNPDDIPDGKRDYAVAKRDAEAAIQKLAAQGLDVAIARCYAFVGPWLPRDQHFAIGNFIADGLAGRPVTVKAKQRVYRSYMYSDDLVRWLIRIALEGNPACPTYNVGSDEACLMGEVAKTVADYFGTNAVIPDILGDQIDRYIPSVDKARLELGLALDYDLKKGVAATVQAIQRRAG